MSAQPVLVEENLLTATQFAVWDDNAADRLHELVAGRLVPMAPPMFDHGEYEVAIVTALRTFVRARKLGRVSGGEVRLLTRRAPDTVRLADALYISYERLVGQDVRSTLTAAPDLVVEIVSPSDAWGAVLEKVGEYLAWGVRLVWIVLPRQQQVYAYRTLADVRVYSIGDLLPGDEVLPGFSVAVAEIFAE